MRTDSPSGIHEVSGQEVLNGLNTIVIVTACMGNTDTWNK